ncbi:hypothetical protein ENBRE01_2732 [Enteropsectra breve]|nr:hypothetical protein ENBRE01_2732 [Enteropsectra breve]
MLFNALSVAVAMIAYSKCASSGPVDDIPFTDSTKEDATKRIKVVLESAKEAKKQHGKLASSSASKHSEYAALKTKIDEKLKANAENAELKKVSSNFESNLPRLNTFKIDRETIVKDITEFEKRVSEWSEKLKKTPASCTVNDLAGFEGDVAKLKLTAEDLTKLTKELTEAEKPLADTKKEYIKSLSWGEYIWHHKLYAGLIVASVILIFILVIVLVKSMGKGSSNGAEFI